MSQHFNRLTPAEAERLAMLAEEAGEVVQAVTKILRHGYESYHPTDPGMNNRSILRAEIADLRAVWELMFEAGDVEKLHSLMIDTAKSRKLRFSHHQGAEE
jgi:hypothetical protein